MDPFAGAQNMRIIGATKPIFREGDPGDRAFIVKSGEVEIWKMIDGERKRLGVVKKGGVFGEMALIDDQPRMASATALTECRLIIISREVFKDKLHKSDPFVVALLRIFARHIRSMTK